MSNYNPKCIICLENDPINNNSGETSDEVLPIPCECKIYCHQYCFDKIEKNECLICKKPYDLEKYSGTNRLSFIEKQTSSNRLMSFDEIMTERTERTIQNTHIQYGCCKFFDQLLQIITFSCMPPVILLAGLLIVWINGMVANMLFCLFFSSIVDKCYLSYNDITVFIVGLSSLTFWFIVFKIITSKYMKNCCLKYCHTEI
jgi:hypothetical protein